MGNSKVKRVPWVVPGFLALVILISFGTFFIGKNTAKREAAQVEDCLTKGPDHMIEIKNDKFTPESVDAKICDELTIVNKDEKLRLVAFGLHDKHIYYDGITENALKKDESMTITLNQIGTYIFHDHLQEEVEGQFSVQ
ncbi:MAG: cupredoxin domain-containing protein [Candidatus Saccharimonadales bacterium]